MFFPVAIELPPTPPAIIRVADLPLLKPRATHAGSRIFTTQTAEKPGTGIGGGGGIRDIIMAPLLADFFSCDPGTGIGGGCGIVDSPAQTTAVRARSCTGGTGINGGCGLRDRLPR